MRRSLVLAVLLMAFAPAAFACECFASNSCVRLASSANTMIFVGTAVAHQGVGDALFREDTTFRLKEALYGEFGQTIVVRGAGTDCDYHFETGKDYLVFATHQDGVLATGKCTGTGLAEDDGAIIRQLRSIRAGSPPADIFGMAIKPPTERTYRALSDIDPAADLTVTAKSDSAQYRTRTRSDGSFDFWPLPPGAYTVALELPSQSRLKVDSEVLKVEVGLSCRTNFRLSHDTEIRGMIVDRTGQPDSSQALSGFITAYKAGTNPDESLGVGVEAGHFTIEGIPPGRYRFSYVPRLKDRPDIRVRIDFQGSEINVTEGGHIDGIRLTVP